jgi:hypothetical protein
MSISWPCCGLWEEVSPAILYDKDRYGCPKTWDLKCGTILYANSGSGWSCKKCELFVYFVKYNAAAVTTLLIRVPIQEWNGYIHKTVYLKAKCDKRDTRLGPACKVL